MRGWLGVPVLVLGVVGVAFVAPASAAVVADWEMNEAPGAQTMVDSGPNHLDGVIGSGVTTGASANGAVGYRWAFVSPTAPPTKPERLVQVANDPKLNPGAGDYAVTVRYRTTQHFGNMVQKGQAGSTTGYWKLENPDGQIKCTFRGLVNGTLRRKAVQSPTVLSDNTWHIVTCARSGNNISLTVDGDVVATASGNTGTISNTRPITIGGKLDCDQITTTCDYYTGDIDYIHIDSSATQTDVTDPTVTQAPKMIVPLGVTLAAKAVPTHVGFAATDASGICSYSLQQSVAGEPYQAVKLATPLTPYGAPQITPGAATHQFQVAATDCAGNQSSYARGPASVLTAYQNGSASIRYTGKWSTSNVSGTYGGSIRSTSATNASASLTFTGREVTWVTSKAANRGVAKVLIDGKQVATVNTYAKTTVRRRVVFTRSFATGGQHTIKVVCSGTKNHPLIDVDAFLVVR